MNPLDILKSRKLGLVSTTIAAGIGVSSYNKALDEGSGVAGAVSKATVETAAAGLIGPGVYLAGAAALKAPGAMTEGAERLNRRAREMGRTGLNAPFAGNTFVDNQQTFTMRQSAVAMMRQSKYNLENAMQGQEAQYLHR